MIMSEFLIHSKFQEDYEELERQKEKILAIVLQNQITHFSFDPHIKMQSSSRFHTSKLLSTSPNFPPCLVNPYLVNDSM
jgi:hypothetical protein